MIRLNLFHLLVAAVSWAQQSWNGEWTWCWGGSQRVESLWSLASYPNPGRPSAWSAYAMKETFGMTCRRSAMTSQQLDLVIHWYYLNHANSKLQSVSTSSRRRSVPNAKTLLNSLSRICLAWETHQTNISIEKRIMDARTSQNTAIVSMLSSPECSAWVSVEWGPSCWNRRSRRGRWELRARRFPKGYYCTPSGRYSESTASRDHWSTPRYLKLRHQMTSEKRFSK